MYQLISGGIMASCWILGFFFLCFWRKTQDRLFAIFSISFTLLGIERFVLGFLAKPSEADPVVYLIRLTAFLLIMFAILDKNKARKAE